MYPAWTSFGNPQGSGTVWIGNTYGTVVGWSDNQIVASVASDAVSGVVKVQQNGNWSNAEAFTVPVSLGSGPQITLMPDVISMLIGESRSIQALDENNQPVTGLTWTSSDTSVVALSTDDPPVLTAVAAGTATINVGSASASVTVYAGSALPLNTTIWSNPGDSSGVSCIIPAVPSSTGVADVLALNIDGNLQAIKTDGTVGWTANVGTNVSCSNLIPDFQGGVVVTTGQSITRLDGMTGAASPSYSSASGNALSTPVVHTDGTIFTVDGNSIVGINPATGMPKFSVSMEDSIINGQTQPSSTVGNLIIAGDGYAYVPYQYFQSTSTASQSVSVSSSTYFLNVLRVGSNGDSTEIPVKQWSQSNTEVTTLGDYIPFGTPYTVIAQGYPDNTECQYSEGCPTSGTVTSLSSYSNLGGLANLITNADQGVLLSFQALEGSQGQTTNTYCYAPACPNYLPSELTNSSSSNNPGATNSYLATISSGGAVSLAKLNLPGQGGPVQPVLQRADGSYVGTVSTSSGSTMLAFTASGQPLWSQPNDIPLIATAEGGVIAVSGNTYDQHGNATGQIAANTIQSWLGNTYANDAITQVFSPLSNLATSFWPWSSGNNSRSNASVPQQQFAQLDSCADKSLNPPPTCPGAREAIWNGEKGLIAKLAGSCSSTAKSKVFDKINTKQGTTFTVTSFLNYLQVKSPQLYDGTRSQASLLVTCQAESGGKYMVCALGRLFTKAGSVADLFSQEPNLAATTIGGNNPLIVFFRPSYIDLTADGKTVDNEAMVFHEALHGFTDLSDRQLEIDLTGSANDFSSVIDTYLINSVFDVCGGA